MREAKTSLRIKSNQFDEELDGIIQAAMADLHLSGVEKVKEYDPLIRRAVILYCKANFGFDEDSERYSAAYDLLKRSLSLAGDYNADE